MITQKNLFQHLQCEKRDTQSNPLFSHYTVNKNESNLIKTVSLFYSVKMQNFNSRLETFKEWPNTNVKPEDLANAGFFYTGTIWKCKLLSPIFYLHYLSPLIYGYFNRTH